MDALKELDLNTRLKERKLDVLLIDDDISMTNLLSEFYIENGYKADACKSAEEALIKVLKEKKTYHLILCDLNLPGKNGLEFINTLESLDINTPIILMTAHGSLDKATKAIKAGASDYITKPINFSELDVVSHRAIRIKSLENNYKKLQRKVAQHSDFQTLIGSSPKMCELKLLISKISKSSSNILILGESGTGKELVARTIHDKSERREKPFIAVNCSAIPSELLESELFGHTKGSFTGAYSDKKGLFEEAHSGTLFLDEIGDMPFSVQAKVLRAVQEKKIRPVGSSSFKNIDVRILAATHKNLKQSVENGEFREDLYFRLSVIPILVPSLRERIEDLPLLSTTFLNRANIHNRKTIKSFTPDAIKKMKSHRWNGNVRELENTIERAVVLSTKDFLSAEDIYLDGHSNSNEDCKTAFQNIMSLKDLEKKYIEYVLKKTNGHKEDASKILGINRKTLYRKQREYNI